MAALRIVVADDHPIWRAGVGEALGDQFQVCAQADDAPSAVAAIEHHRPDLALCDLHMPGGGGIAVVTASAALCPIVICTVSNAERDLLDAVAAGAVGYLLKSSTPDELRDACQRAAAGEPVFSPTLAALVMGEFRRLATQSGPADALSTREREVLSFVARGWTYKRVGEELFISPKTVENHVRNILAKLHLSRRDDLVRFAITHGLD
ncbi:MAG: response regulator [Acidimicrobiales bacterium]